jgi:hypothetical protein
MLFATAPNRGHPLLLRSRGTKRKEKLVETMKRIPRAINIEELSWYIHPH